MNDWRKLYPFKSHELALDGERYHYLDEGHGPALLLVHGNPTWSFYWRRLVLSLRDRYRVIVPDHIGCGLSSKPRDYEYHLARHVANLRRLVETLDLSEITLIGHDWGGAIGLDAAIEMPERFARLILANTAGFRSQRIPFRIRICRTPILGRLAVQGLNAFARSALWMATEYPQRMTAEVRAGLIAPYDSWAHRRATYEFVRDIPLSPRHPSYAKLAEIETGLAKLADRPTLFVWGMKDWCFSPHFLERFLEFFPHATVRRIDHAGHYVVEDAPDEVIDAIEDFLVKHPLGVGAR